MVGLAGRFCGPASPADHWSTRGFYPGRSRATARVPGRHPGRPVERLALLAGAIPVGSIAYGGGELWPADHSGGLRVAGRLSGQSRLEALAQPDLAHYD